MVISRPSIRRVGVVLAVVSLCAASAGCVSDMGASAADDSVAGHQMRYDGGPKYPMWSSQ